MRNSIEIKNDFEEEEENLRKSIMETLTQRVKAKKGKLFGKPKKYKKKRGNGNFEVEYVKTTLLHPRNRLGGHRKSSKKTTESTM